MYRNISTPAAGSHCVSYYSPQEHGCTFGDTGMHMTQQGNNGQEFTNSSSCMYTPHTCRGLCTVHDGVSKSCVTCVVQTPYHPSPGPCPCVVIDKPLCCCSSICILVTRDAEQVTERLHVSGLLKNRPHIIHCEGGGCEER